MTKRQIIHIDEEKCDGCGLCIPGCPEGAMKIINGKARLVRESLCDGLGACIGHCPKGAIEITEKETEDYDERLVVENIVENHPEALERHLNHLQEHRETDHLKVAFQFLNDHSARKREAAPKHHGCPGSGTRIFEKRTDHPRTSTDAPSQLKHWPVQLHLISPASAAYFKKDVLISADCVAYALGNFHDQLLRGKSLAIACPKLDQGQEIYLKKLIALIDEAEAQSLTVATMEVPCCSGLLHLVLKAREMSERKPAVHHIHVGLEGSLLNQQTL